MLSVIVPIFNIEKYLHKCIESIVNQTYTDLEILLIDDGSTDSSSQMCDQYAQRDSRIKVVHKKNEGLVQARKTGLKHATGNYITFVDGDDWIDVEMYRQLVKEIEISNADFLDSGFFRDRKTSIETERRTGGIYDLKPHTKHEFFKALINMDSSVKISPSIWSKIFKTDIIRASYAKVPDNIQHGEDVINLIYCLLEARNILQSEKIFYHYNCREDSMSHLKSVSYLRKEIDLWSYCGNIILECDKYAKREEIDRFLFQKIYSAFGYLSTYEFDVIQYYAFPYVEMLFDKKIALYGAGKVGKDYYTQISKYERCDIVCWADKNYDKFHLSYRKIVSTEDLLHEDYDVVLLAVAQKRTAQEMKAFLLEHGVAEDKILWYGPRTII